MEMTDDGKWNEMNDNVVANLHLTIADEVLSSISEIKTAKIIWDTLTKKYEVKSLPNKIFLKRRLYTLRMTESSSMTDHINTLNTLFAQLTSIGHKIEENERAKLVLQSLPDLYDQLSVGVKLVYGDPEKVGHLDIEKGDGKPEATPDLV